MPSHGDPFFAIVVRGGVVCGGSIFCCAHLSVVRGACALHSRQNGASVGLEPLFVPFLGQVHPHLLKRTFTQGVGADQSEQEVSESAIGTHNGGLLERLGRLRSLTGEARIRSSLPGGRGAAG